MRRLLTNIKLWFAVLLVAGLLIVALWPRAVPVEVTAASRGPLVVTVDEEGETRVRDRFVVSAPVAGRVLRIDLEPGDRVRPGMVVARVRAQTPPLLDARTRAEAVEALAAARAAVNRAQADEQQARTQLSRVMREAARVRELMRGGLATGQQTDSAEADVRAAEEAASSATYAVQMAQADVRRAEARLAPVSPVEGDRVVSVTSPVEGVVLRRVRESEAVVPAGEPLVEVGDPTKLEVVADLLSSDAVKVKPGQRVIVEDWGGDQPLSARVRRIEPAGFTKVSALGVDEQRVNVVMDFAGGVVPAIGDAFRVEVRVVLWESATALKVPTSALFRRGSAWAVFVVNAGMASAREVTLGQRNGQEAEVVSGLQQDELVVLHPGDTIGDGTKVVVASTR